MRNALGALPGVEHVHFDFDTKVATVSFNKSAKPEDDAKLITALKDEGFGGTVTDHGKMPE